MKEYLVCFKPLEAYFFGNEKIFGFSKGEGNRYYIKSEYLPSQSTILGTIRYMLLPVKKADWKYSEDEARENRITVGENGFSPENRGSDYGKIEKISPVFLVGTEGVLVHTPYNHTEGNGEYTPFSEFGKVYTSEGKEKYFTEQYNSKSGITHSYMQLSDGKIVSQSDIFGKNVRVGINRREKKDGFFKKEYKVLSDGYCFAVYLTLDDDISPENGIVHMGQGKSAFSVTFVEQKNNLEEAIRKYIPEDVVYCMGDVFTRSDIYSDTFFAVTETKTYRHFRQQGNRVEKGGVLYNIISAGSVFIPCNKEEFVQNMSDNAFGKVGYNLFVYHKGVQNEN